MKAMLRACLQALISPAFIALIDVVILVPIALSAWDVTRDIFFRHDVKEPIEIVVGIGVIMIGWGVALEERHALREIFGLVGGASEALQAELDQLCHHVGVGQLILGLFAEICVEMIHLPNHIVNTEGIENGLLGFSVMLIAAGGVILIFHVFKLLGRRQIEVRSPG